MHTGDMAVLGEKGYCRIVGRLKDLIIRGGENISPKEVEEVIHQHKAVMDVQVRFCMFCLSHSSTGRFCSEHGNGLCTVWQLIQSAVHEHDVMVHASYILQHH